MIVIVRIKTCLQHISSLSETLIADLNGLGEKERVFECVFLHNDVRVGERVFVCCMRLFLVPRALVGRHASCSTCLMGEEVSVVVVVDDDDRFRYRRNQFLTTVRVLVWLCNGNAILRNPGLLEKKLSQK